MEQVVVQSPKGDLLHRQLEVTDCGFPSTLVKQRLKGADLLVIESNYDERSLRESPYPWSVKQRIRSRHGHLSNDETAKLVSDIFDGKDATVILAHLSENCNTPDLARNALENKLSSNGESKNRIFIAPRKGVGEVVTI